MRAQRPTTHETLFRLGIVRDLLPATMAIFLTIALYRLFKGVDEGLARLVVILGALMADFLSVFDKPQRDALVLVFLRIHGRGILANEVFWGLCLFPSAHPRRLADTQLLRLSGYKRHRDIVATIRAEGLELGFPGDVRRARHHAVAHNHERQRAAAPGGHRLTLWGLEMILNHESSALDSIADSR